MSVGGVTFPLEQQSKDPQSVIYTGLYETEGVTHTKSGERQPVQISIQVQETKQRSESEHRILSKTSLRSRNMDSCHSPNVYQYKLYVIVCSNSRTNATHSYNPAELLYILTQLLFECMMWGEHAHERDETQCLTSPRTESLTICVRFTQLFNSDSGASGAPRCICVICVMTCERPSGKSVRVIFLSPSHFNLCSDYMFQSVHNTYFIWSSSLLYGALKWLSFSLTFCFLSWFLNWSLTAITCTYSPDSNKELHFCISADQKRDLLWSSGVKDQRDTAGWEGAIACVKRHFSSTQCCETHFSLPDRHQPTIDTDCQVK